MRVLILTIQKSIDSIGACLQAYALWRKINELDKIEADVLDLYRPVSLRFRNMKELKCNKFSEFIKFSKKIVKLFIKRQFISFNNRLTYSKGYNIVDLYRQPPDYDVYISGSDQIWNPDQPYQIEPYFCTFTDKRKCSYASSIGTDVIDEENLDKIVNWLQEYQNVSVRELSTKKKLSQKLKKDISVHLDPTFLLSMAEWDSISKKVAIDNDYIFCFSVETNKEFVEFCERVLPKENLLFFGKSTNKNNKTSCFVSHYGPSEFLWIIRHAKHVITDSFHGTAMSIIYNKNFNVVINKNNRRKLSRIVDLLSFFNISDQILNDQDSEINLEKKINYDSINCIIKSEKENSMEFIMKGIGFVS